jgi:hypothetical protein
VTSRPYAADDFTAIRARLEELRRERDQGEADEKRSPVGPKPYRRAATSAADHQDNRLVPRAFRKFGR